MSHPRKTLRQYAAEIDQWIARGWLTGQETFVELQDMAMMSELMALEAGGDARGHLRPDVQAEILGIKGRFQEVLAPLRRHAPDRPLLDVLRPVLEAHPGMSAGMALYWLRRQSG